MAGAGGTPTPTPLRLKDLLELDCDSCSAAGFRCYPRRLVGESASAPMRHLSLRSLSRRLSRRGGFWSRRRDREDEDAAAAASAGSSSSEELETSSEASSDNSVIFSSATEDSVHRPSQAAAAGAEHEVAMKRVVSSSSGSEADDKEQLSPVAVMDFPFDDDDDELRDAAVACSPPSFSLARLQRRKTHKIRRFRSRDDEMAPLDLEARLATTSDPDSPVAAVPPQQQMILYRTEDTATTPTCAGCSVHDVPDEDDDLISLLLMGTISGGMDDASERLLLDFFVEMKRRRRSKALAEAELLLSLLGQTAAGGLLQRKAEQVVDGESAVAAEARGWLEGTGTVRWGLADVLSGGEAIVAEMDQGRRWMQVGEEEREVAAVVAGMLVDQLVLEVVRCLFV